MAKLPAGYVRVELALPPDLAAVVARRAADQGYSVSALIGVELARAFGVEHDPPRRGRPPTPKKPPATRRAGSGSKRR